MASAYGAGRRAVKARRPRSYALDLARQHREVAVDHLAPSPSPLAGDRREADPERASTRVAAHELEPSAVGLDGPPGNRQTQPRTTELPRASPIDPVEPIEHPVAMLGSDAGAGVADLDAGTSCAVAHDDPHLAAVRTVPDRVIDEIHERLPEENAIDARDGGLPTLHDETLPLLLR